MPPYATNVVSSYSRAISEHAVPMDSSASRLPELDQSPQSRGEWKIMCNLIIIFVFVGVSSFSNSVSMSQPVVSRPLGMHIK